MPRKHIDVSGQRFGRLVAVARVGSTLRKSALWECVCDCGQTAYAAYSSLREGKTRSCGCYKREVSRDNMNNHRVIRVKHGHARAGQLTPTYNTWSAMLGRCTRPSHAKWEAYGARGITVCDRWLSFENFLADMGERPPGTTLDRVDVDGNYTRANCRWATPKEQRANQRADKQASAP